MSTGMEGGTLDRKAELRARIRELRAERKAQLNAKVEEFFNHNHDLKGRFAPSPGGESIGERVDKIGILGPQSRFRKKDLKKLSDPQLRKLHAHLETNSRKWGAAVVGIGIVSGVAGIAVGLGFLGPVVTNVVNAYLTRTRERFAVGNEAQRRGIHLKFGVRDGLQEEFSVADDERMAKEELEAFLHPDLDKMSQEEITQALQDGLEAIQDLLSDPEEELTAGERKALKDSQAAIELVLEKR